MAKSTNQLKILIVDDDDLLMSEAEAFSHPAIEFSALSPAQVSASRGSMSDRDIVVVGVDTLGGLDLVADLCSRAGMPPVVALAGRVSHGRSEHVLLLAELSGAALSLPKPIDAVELTLAAVELMRAKSDLGDVSQIAKDLESRLE